MQTPKTIIHLLSGGLDSVTMLYDLNNQEQTIHCLLVDYQQAHKKELEFAKYHASLLRIPCTLVELPPLGGLTKKNWIVPHRNAILISIAVNLAVKTGADTVTIGCNSEDADYFPDCRKSFIDQMNKLVKTAGLDVEVCAPYLLRSKAWIGGMAQEFGIKPKQIWTCYNPDEKNNPCGKCPACEKLKKAFK